MFFHLLCIFFKADNNHVFVISFFAFFALVLFRFFNLLWSQDLTLFTHEINKFEKRYSV